HPRRRAALDLELARLGEAVEIQRIEAVPARALQIDPERIAHFRERRAADDVKAERRAHDPAQPAGGQRPRRAVECGDELPPRRGWEVAAARLGARILRVLPGELPEPGPASRRPLPPPPFRFLL